MRHIAALIGSILLLASCGAGDRSFRQIQFCLNGQNDIQALKATVQAIAQSQEMDFTDRSADAESELESIRKDMPNVRVAHPTIVLDAHRRDGLGFGGMNFGDAPLQFAFGF